MIRNTFVIVTTRGLLAGAMCALGWDLYAQAPQTMRSILEQDIEFEETLPAPQIEPVAKARLESDSSPPPLPRHALSAPPSPPLPRVELQTLPTPHGYDLLLQGPVHEAFLAPFDPEAQTNIAIIGEPPPLPINELPPTPPPAGQNIQWLDGYWAWLDEAQSYAWVSGLYRDVPPERVWRAGEWSPTQAGYRWTSGYWSETNQQIGYLTRPPQSVDAGPSSSPPTSDSLWLPGHWVYADDEYHWQAGYWTNQPENWIWQPAYYVNTPLGYVFVSGYWDYEPSLRGQPYAPLIYTTSIYTRPYYSLRPIYPLAPSASLLLHLFVCPGYRHYFYGDYYDNSFVDLGYRPWYHPQRMSPSEASPLLGYYDWKYRRNSVDFIQNMTRYEKHFQANPGSRPARQVSTNPALALEHGMAGAVAASSFDQLVRGSVSAQLATASSATPKLPNVENASSSNVGSGARQANATSSTPRVNARPNSPSLSATNPALAGAAARTSPGPESGGSGLRSRIRSLAEAAAANPGGPSPSNNLRPSGPPLPGSAATVGKPLSGPTPPAGGRGLGSRLGGRGN